MTTSDYLEQLQTDKQTLVTNLNAKNISANNNETFTTLCPKVANIPTYITATSEATLPATAQEGTIAIIQEV